MSDNLVNISFSKTDRLGFIGQFADLSFRILLTWVANCNFVSQNDTASKQKLVKSALFSTYVERRRNVKRLPTSAPCVLLKVKIALFQVTMPNEQGTPRFRIMKLISFCGGGGLCEEERICEKTWNLMQDVEKVRWVPCQPKKLKYTTIINCSHEKIGWGPLDLKSR